jgi:hypothetical protein
VFESRGLDTISIPKSCRESWGGMPGDDRERFCTSCQKAVHDFSNLTRREASRLLRGSENHVCARINFDDRGRIVFRREPESKVMRWLAGMSLLGASAFAQAPADTTKCTVDVKVSDITSAGIARAIVSLAPAQDAKAVSGGTTDDQGVFRDKISPGHYALKVESPGFALYRQDVTVSCSNPLPINVDVKMSIGVVMGEVVSVSNRGPLGNFWFSAKSAVLRVTSL